MENHDSVNDEYRKYSKALSAVLGYRDPFTQRHSDRVLGLCTQLGMGCGLTDDELATLKVSSLLHDVGKIGIPDRILLKPSKLDETEWSVMERHSEFGERILESTELEGVHRCARAVRHHHEHYSGHGYPDKLAGEDIPIFSRIISIADSYDAMAMARPYHPSKSHREIMTILGQETGEKFDPALMRVFSTVIEHSKFKAPEVGGLESDKAARKPDLSSFIQ